MAGKRILITGAANGLGRALAICQAQSGANLFLLDKDSHGLDMISDEVCRAGFEEPGVCPLDLAHAGVAEYEQIGRILETEFGGLDVIVHCAAEFQGLQPLDQHSPGFWQQCMQANVNAPWQLTMACLGQLKKSEHGRVVFVHEDRSILSSAYWGAYAVSKAALVSLSSILAQELLNTRIKVLNYTPPPLRTALRAQAFLTENPVNNTNPSGPAKRLSEMIDSGSLS